MTANKASQRSTKSASAAAPDPIFAIIETHKSLAKQWARLSDQLEDAAIDAAAEHGTCPAPLIHWRGYTIGDFEIEMRRNSLLAAAEIDPVIIQQEYTDARERYQAQVAARLAWENRTGLLALRKEVDHLADAAGRQAKRLASSKPTTPAGVGAVIQYVLNDYLCADEGYWHTTALKTAADTLTSMFGTNILNGE